MTEPDHTKTAKRPASIEVSAVFICQILGFMLALDLSTGQKNPVIHQRLKDTGSNHNTYGTLVTLTEYIFCDLS